MKGFKKQISHISSLGLMFCHLEHIYVRFWSELGPNLSKGRPIRHFATLIKPGALVKNGEENLALGEFSMQTFAILGILE